MSGGMGAGGAQGANGSSGSPSSDGSQGASGAQSAGGAQARWEQLVAQTPAVAAAFAELGTRGGERRSRARRAAAEVDADRAGLIDLVWQLQAAAADGAVRTRILAGAARYRHEERAAAQATAARGATAAGSLAGGAGRTRGVAAPGAAPGTGSRAHTVVFVIGLLLALLAPALVMPRFRGGGFVYDVDQVALLSGVVSLALAAAGLIAVSRFRRALFGAAVPVILAIWVAIGAVVASVRLAGEPALASPAAIAGIVVMAVAVVVHLVAAVVARGGFAHGAEAADAGGGAAGAGTVASRNARRSRAASSARGDGVPDATLAALAEAVADEQPDAAVLRRAAYADGILTLMKRDVLDEYDAATLLAYAL